MVVGLRCSFITIRAEVKAYVLAVGPRLSAPPAVGSASQVVYPNGDSQGSDLGAAVSDPPLGLDIPGETCLCTPLLEPSRSSLLDHVSDIFRTINEVGYRILATYFGKHTAPHYQGAGHLRDCFIRRRWRHSDGTAGFKDPPMVQSTLGDPTTLTAATWRRLNHHRTKAREGRGRMWTFAIHLAFYRQLETDAPHHAENWALREERALCEYNFGVLITNSRIYQTGFNSLGRDDCVVYLLIECDIGPEPAPGSGLTSSAVPGGDEGGGSAVPMTICSGGPLSGALSAAGSSEGTTLLTGSAVSPGPGFGQQEPPSSEVSGLANKRRRRRRRGS